MPGCCLELCTPSWQRGVFSLCTCQISYTLCIFFTENPSYLLRTQGDSHWTSGLSRRGCAWKAGSHETRAFTPCIWARTLLGQRTPGISSKHNIIISFATHGLKTYRWVFIWPSPLTLSMYKSWSAKDKKEANIGFEFADICAYSCMCLITCVYVFSQHLPRREGVGGK